MAKKMGLGRGLSAILPDVEEVCVYRVMTWQNSKP